MEQTFNDYETLIIDAHSSDRTVDIAKKYPVRIIYEEGKKSYGRASNIGIKNAVGRYVAFISAAYVWYFKYLVVRFDAFLM